MRPRLAILTVCGLALLGCPSEDPPSGGGGEAPGGKVSSAAKNFLSFAKGDEPAAAAPAPGLKIEPVRYTIVRNVEVPGDRLKRRLEIEVPLSITRGALEATLREASRRRDLGDAALVEIWAHPGKLRNLTGAFGLLTVARDGKAVPRTEGLNERLLIEERLGVELDLDETRAIVSMDAAAGKGSTLEAVIAAGVTAGLDEDGAEELLEKLEEHWPAPSKVK